MTFFIDSSGRKCFKLPDDFGYGWRLLIFAAVRCWFMFFVPFSVGAGFEHAPTQLHFMIIKYC